MTNCRILKRETLQNISQFLNIYLSLSLLLARFVIKLSNTHAATAKVWLTISPRFPLTFSRKKKYSCRRLFHLSLNELVRLFKWSEKLYASSSGRCQNDCTREAPGFRSFPPYRHSLYTCTSYVMRTMHSRLCTYTRFYFRRGCVSLSKELIDGQRKPANNIYSSPLWNGANSFICLTYAKIGARGEKKTSPSRFVVELRNGTIRRSRLLPLWTNW